MYSQMSYRSIFDDRVYITSNYDGNKYLVRNTEQKQESANALARSNDRILKFIHKLEETVEPENVPIVKRLRKRYRYDTLMEGRIDARYTTYTVNKGENISFCLRTRDEYDQLYDDNLLTGVALHELGHISSVTTQHNHEFYRNFAYLLAKATAFGMFKPITKSVNYCGLSTTIS
jgi:hypothetical protein